MDKRVSLQQRITEKQQELQNLAKVQHLTSQLSISLETLQEKLSELSDGTESVALVLSNWSSIVRATSLASMSLLKYSVKDYENENDPPLTETLVRVRIDKDTEEKPIQLESEKDEEMM